GRGRHQHCESKEQSATRAQYKTRRRGPRATRLSDARFDDVLRVRRHQNLYVALSVTRRIAPVPITYPNVGEFRTVSMVVNCGRLKTLFAAILNSSARVSLARRVLLTDISKL